MVLKHIYVQKERQNLINEEAKLTAGILPGFFRGVAEQLHLQGKPPR